MGEIADAPNFFTYEVEGKYNLSVFGKPTPRQAMYNLQSILKSGEPVAREVQRESLRCRAAYEELAGASMNNACGV